MRVLLFPIMTPDTWKRIKSILDKALVLRPSERPAFLDEACGTDTHIRDEVESLLGTNAPTGFMDHAPARAGDGLIPGDTIASYRIVGEIGRGGMGVVYRAVHTGLDREFALKTLKASAGSNLALARFQREAKVLGSLKHPHIVDVTDFGTAGEVPYLVMELVSGETLRERSRNPLSADESLEVLKALGSAVDYAHSRGVLHGDLKPENVILADGSCKVLDFGLAGLVAPDTEDGARVSAPIPSFAGTDSVTELATGRGVAGTPSYMAPELFAGARPSFATDLYALAVLAFEILVGQRPFFLMREDLSADGWRRPPTPRPSELNTTLPREMDEPLMRALSANPSERPSTAADFSRRLREELSGGRRRLMRRRALPSRLLASLAVAAVVGVSSSAFWNARWVRGLENRLIDVRWALLPTRAANPDILLATVDDRWLEAHPESLSEQGDLFGERLSSLFDAGARAVALDIVLPREWSESEEFSRLVLSHTDQLTLAAFGSFADGTIRGRECINRLTASNLGPERLERLFGLVNLEPDDDGAVRRSQWGFADSEGRMRLAWASRAATTLRGDLPRRDSFLRDQTVPLDAVATASFHELPELLLRSPERVRGKLVILGATYEGSADTFRATDENGVERNYPGALVQASLVHTLLSGVWVEEVGKLPVLVASCLLLFGLALLVTLPGIPRMYLLAAPALLVLYALVSLAAFRSFHLLLPTAGPLASLAVGLTGAVLLRRLLP